MSCPHAKLIGKFGTEVCPDCGQTFRLKTVEVVGSSRRPVPYWGTYAIPVNWLGWYVGDGVHLD